MPLTTTFAGDSARGFGLYKASGGGSSFESIATVTASGGESSLSFSSIPSTYVAIQIRGISRDGADSAVVAQFNSDTSSSNYDHHRLYGNGSTVTANGYATGTFGWALMSLTNGVPASTYAGFICDIHNYASTSQYKTVRSFYGQDQNGSGLIGLASSLWLSTSAISTVLLKPYSGTFSAGTKFALYGIKGA